ncbi:1,6-anhydro-N-acetylmuramyl-L-alanine amidase AmpD [Sansalvadorimonas sp. 2012CJ34-2]|uniref:1,6-anhydro-N-acetylmuramyl-L-alanine amidase AmpD n=1 Tax=Parendozoicomonas callyspongiae TaxID=2942213 RepID=A0ABT0PGT8_9GAMM|nr:1,6-anhydro-N-acetylmuramyl-L-alanine amidase AmpD [Sansalvadorimonas sp. 2012CJ34-2]MCL6270535.1 1,6-anhydro-N-acetylmuramyl-L-alanine amidase AmpD [Sansalvadorimonas sp. 2012CJ34-2]
MKIENGWLDAARICPSPNFDKRPEGTDIDLLVIHNISLPPGQFGGSYINQLFTNTLNPDDHPFFQEVAGMEVSAHLLISRDGSCTQFVSFDDRAWHAGVSCWQGRTACNDFAIGIELEGADDVAYDERQYEALAAVTRELLVAYPKLTVDTITGHSDIAPGRKTDPGKAFDWQRYRSLI